MAQPVLTGFPVEGFSRNAKAVTWKHAEARYGHYAHVPSAQALVYEPFRKAV